MLNGKYVGGGVNIGNVEIAGFPKEYRGENCVRNENVQNESVESVGQERNVGVGGGGGVTIPVMEYVEKGDKGCPKVNNVGAKGCVLILIFCLI